jgi:hypothetical protein
MAEAMTVELIVDAYWNLKEFWTRSRVSFQTGKRGWSDFDIIAYKPSSQTLVVSESKARGRARDVFAFNSYTKKYAKRKYNCSTFAEYEKEDYLSFISNIPHIWENNLIFGSYKKFKESVSELIIQLVSNYTIIPELLLESEESIKNLFLTLAPRCPFRREDIHVNLTTPFNLFCEIQSIIIKEPQGHRYGNAILDLARELNRYLYPKVRYGGRGASALLKKETSKRLFEAFGLK